MNTFKVITAKLNAKRTGTVMKLVSETDADAMFGKAKKITVYVSAQKSYPVGTELQIELNDWNVKEYPFLDENGELPVDEAGKPICDESGNPLMLKWLHVK